MPPVDDADDRHEDVADNRIHQTTERATDDHADREVDHVAPQRELPETP